MPSDEPDSTEPINPTDVPPDQTAHVPTVPGRPSRRWVWTLAAGVLAGLIAWLGGEACLDLIKPPRHPVNSKGIILMVVDPREQDVADARNAGLAFVWLGGALGACLGAAGGLVRRSGRAAASAGALGLVAGAVACAGLSLATMPRYVAYKHHYPDEASRDLFLPIVVLASVWSAAGAAGGLAYGLGLGRRQGLTNIVLAGLGCAAVSAAVYELIGAMALPMDQTTRFVSTTWESRLFARLAVTTLTAVGVAWAASSPRQSSEDSRA